MLVNCFTVLSLEKPKWGACCLMSLKKGHTGMDRILNVSLFLSVCACVKKMHALLSLHIEYFIAILKNNGLCR